MVDEEMVSSLTDSTLQPLEAHAGVWLCQGLQSPPQPPLPPTTTPSPAQTRDLRPVFLQAAKGCLRATALRRNVVHRCLGWLIACGNWARGICRKLVRHYFWLHCETVSASECVIEEPYPHRCGLMLCRPLQAQIEPKGGGKQTGFFFLSWDICLFLS